jgi:thiamine pyrophosphate-dependent acetolactate synthase large subunit-like protein
MPSATAQFESNRLGGSYTQIAAGMGLWAKRVEQPNDVTSSIRRALEVTAEGSSALLEIITGEENSFSRVSWMTGG